jgi:hypothetical protein
VPEETGKYTTLKAEFADMTESQLRGALERWCFNALSARDDLRHYKAGTQYERDENTLKLARVGQLVDVRRKTLRMADLIEALKDSTVLEAEATASGQVSHG